MTTRSFPGYLSSFQGFFKGMAVVGGHIGGEDNPGYGQGEHKKQDPTDKDEVLSTNDY